MIRYEISFTLKKIVNFLKLYCIVIGNEHTTQISAF